MTINWINGDTISMSSMIAINMDNKDHAKRIIVHLMTRGLEFAYNTREGDHTVYLPNSVHLDKLAERFPDIKFDIWR